jgi:hypothetical protein
VLIALGVVIGTALLLRNGGVLITAFLVYGNLLIQPGHHQCRPGDRHSGRSSQPQR